MIFVYSTFPKKTEAEKIGDGLVRKKLAGCVNIFPVDSIYRWQGKIVKNKEVAMFIKTKKENFDRVEKYILENHSYKNSCIAEMPVNRVAQKYLKWLNAAC